MASALGSHERLVEKRIVDKETHILGRVLVKSHGREWVKVGNSVPELHWLRTVVRYRALLP